MISARVFIFVFLVGRIFYELVLSKLNDIQRRKPLPDEVSDVYDKDRYQTYLSYTAEKKKLSIKFKTINLFFDSLIIFSPVYEYIDTWCNHNSYLAYLVIFAITWGIELVVNTISSYIETFGIMEKYGMNKKDKKEFTKDIVLNGVFELIISVGLGELLTYIGEHMAVWTNDFSVGYVKSIIICAIIFVVLFLVFSLAKLIAFAVLKKQYKFTRMEDGPLRDKINSLLAGSRKKVKEIYVYNESKKSTRKNAFLLKLFWHREFGIADNFMNENAEDELMAVLSHEIGHLKHKKNLLNFLKYLETIAIMVLIVLLVVNPDIILSITNWIRESFHISANNYNLIIIVFFNIYKPVSFLSHIFNSYVSRTEEYEADREAVKNGYGEALIRTFKNLSSDELINVYPHPVVEFIEYDHPGMYQRIKAINS